MTARRSRDMRLVSWWGAAAVVTALAVGYALGRSGKPALERTALPESHAELSRAAAKTGPYIRVEVPSESHDDNATRVAVPSESHDDDATRLAEGDPPTRDAAAGGQLENAYHAIFDKLESELDADRFARFYGAVRKWNIQGGFIPPGDEYENAKWEHRVDTTGMEEHNTRLKRELVSDLEGILTTEQIADFLRYQDSRPARRTVDHWLASSSVVRPADESLEIVYGVMTEQRRTIPHIEGTDPTARAKALGDAWRQVNAAVDERLFDVLTAEQLSSFSKYRHARTKILELEVELIDPSRVPKLGYSSEY